MVRRTTGPINRANDASLQQHRNDVSRRGRRCFSSDVDAESHLCRMGVIICRGIPSPRRKYSFAEVMDAEPVKRAQQGHKEQHYRELLGEQARSGLTLKSFAEHRGLT